MSNDEIERNTAISVDHATCIQTYKSMKYLGKKWVHRTMNAFCLRAVGNVNFVNPRVTTEPHKSANGCAVPQCVAND